MESFKATAGKVVCGTNNVESKTGRNIRSEDRMVSKSSTCPGMPELLQPIVALSQAT